MNRRNVLLMSATIAPPSGMPGSVRSDPAIRFNDYRAALGAYLAMPSTVIDRIVFLENSGYDLDELRRDAARVTDKSVEFISVRTDSPPEKGKGYGEFRMMDEGLSRSRLITRDDLVWKVTGRLSIGNLPALMASAPDDVELYCDLRDIPLIGTRYGANRWMELRLFAFTLAAYDRFFRDRYDSGFVLENAFFSIVNAAVDDRDAQICPRFRVQPVISGHSGFTGASYRSLSFRAKEKFRIVSRRVAPNLWI